MDHQSLSVKEDRLVICGWPTDTLAIDHRGLNSDDSDNTHTLLLFIPGNPGVIHWYTDSLAHIIKRLGRGYAARGVSYAGHGVGEDVVGTTDDHKQSFHSEKLGHNNKNASEEEQPKDMSISWTMDGQLEHKIKWIDKVLQDWRKQSKPTPNSMSKPTPNLVFISHSIGAHFVQCLLIRRPDILAKTKHIIFLMPFFRFDPPPVQKLILSSGAHSYKYSIPLATNMVRTLSSTLPRNWIDFFLDKFAGVDCDKGRRIALDIFMHPNMVKNHLVLGLQEVRELPEIFNDVALRLIGDISPTSVLFCGFPDQWAPKFHLDQLKVMQSRGEIPTNVHTEYMEELRHDYVVHPEMINPVVRFCVDRIKSDAGGSGINIRSRL